MRTRFAAHRDHYRERYNRDRAGTVALLASLEPGVTPTQATTLREFERRHGDELLASARAAFPELRRRASASLPPPVQPVASAHRAGWYRRVGGSPVVKDAGRSRMPLWQNYVPPERGEPGQHFVEGLQSGPAPFPAGLEVK